MESRHHRGLLVPGAGCHRRAHAGHDTRWAEEVPQMTRRALLILIAIAITACAEQRKPWTAKNLYEAIESAKAEQESFR
ncbi:hypothetical protein G6L30_17110 [Agrobacterium rhizogenes]|nr:hypothetical protein [Rhizobium rhizogenes]